MKPIPEPGPDAPPWAWSVYFDEQLQIIKEDLVAERTTFDQVIAKIRKQWRDERKALRGPLSSLPYAPPPCPLVLSGFKVRRLGEAVSGDADSNGHLQTMRKK